MRTRLARIEPRTIAAPAVVTGAIAVLAAATATGVDPRYVLVAYAPLVAVAVGHGRLLAWRNLIAALLLVILFIPIRRYGMPGHLPFQLEPYRLFVGILALGWLASLLVDPRVRLRPSGLGLQLFLIAAAALLSVVASQDRVRQLGVTTDVTKKLTFLASFLIVFLLIVSVVRTFADLDALVRLLVGAGAVLACLGLIEAAISYNVFNHLHAVMPFLRPEALPYSLSDHRGGRLRVYGSAEHPIAFGAALVMLVPLGVYVARSAKRTIWWLALLLLILGALATVSRTAVVMMGVILLVYLRHRPRQVRRMWPALLPLLVVVHFALPGTIGTLKDSFFPRGGLIAEQRKGEGARGTGRVNEIGPSIAEWSQRPLFGEGFGTRITDKLRQNAPILDNQWLGTLLETGLIGVVGWVWMFTRFARRMGQVARGDPTDRGWLATGLEASVLAFSVGMLTYDAFSFIQVTFLLYILLACGSVLTAAVGD